MQNNILGYFQKKTGCQRLQVIVIGIISPCVFNSVILGHTPAKGVTGKLMPEIEGKLAQPVVLRAPVRVIVFGKAVIQGWSGIRTVTGIRKGIIELKPEIGWIKEKYI